MHILLLLFQSSFSHPIRILQKWLPMAILLLFSLPSCAQFESVITPKNYQTSPEIDRNFHEFLNRLIQMSPDTLPLPQHPAPAGYRLLFQTHHSFSHQFMIFDSCYADSLHMICMENISASGDSFAFPILFVQPEATFRTTVKTPTRVQIPGFYYWNLENEVNYIRSFQDIMSFGQGKYLILHQRRSGPDIRSSMPPGVDITWFLARMD